MIHRDTLRKGFGAVEVIIIGVLVLIIGGLGAYALYGKPKTAEPAASSNPVSNTVPSATTAVTSNSAVSEIDAKTAAASFFIAYIARDNGNGTVISELGTAKLKAYVSGAEKYADPILCAQNKPVTVVAKSVTVSGDTAKVLTSHVYTSGDIEVLATLVKVDGQLKVDSITCPDPATGKQK